MTGDLYSVIKHCFWNIQGFKSQILGKKLISQDFRNEIQNSDIIGLAETHIHEQVLGDLDIPGYVQKHFENRKAHSNGKCGSGGLAIFCKPDISEFVTKISNDNDDTIWVKIGKNLSGKEKDTYLATCYISPNGTKETIEKKLKNFVRKLSVSKGNGTL